MELKDSTRINALRKIQLLLMDVDGVLTDGSITYSDDGSEIKTFNVKDGLGIRMALDKGINIGIITGRSSKALLKRCEDLGIQIIYDHVKDKTKALYSILEETGFLLEEAAFIGDDLPDIPVMEQVGLSFAVADAVEECLKAAGTVTCKKGGQGAVREVCDMMLAARRLKLDQHS